MREAFRISSHQKVGSMRQGYLAALALMLLAGSPVSAQIVSGVMTVTGAEMH